MWVLFGGDGAERQESLANGRAAWLALAGPGGGAAEAFVLEPAQFSGRREPERRRTLLRKRNELLVSLGLHIIARSTTKCCEATMHAGHHLDSKCSPVSSAKPPYMMRLRRAHKMHAT